MDLRQFRQFVAVAETRSFRRAAEQLHMAQPPLSVAIRKLEAQIGVDLFSRSPQGVQLTAAGEATLDAARRCLRDADELVAAARAAAGGEAGRLRLGFIGSVTFGLMPRLIQAFQARYPNVRLELQEADNQGVLGAIVAQTLDMGFVRLPTRRPAGVDFQLVQRDVFVAALPAQHPLARRKSVTLAELGAWPFIGYCASPVGGLHAAAAQLLMQAGVSPMVAQEAVQVHTVIGLVDSGLGVALVPSVNAVQAARGVVFRPVRDLGAAGAAGRIGIGLAHRIDGEPVVGRRFREVAANHGRQPRRRRHKRERRRRTGPARRLRGSLKGPLQGPLQGPLTGPLPGPVERPADWAG